jgi:hypothetical protein
MLSGFAFTERERPYIQVSAVCQELPDYEEDVLERAGWDARGGVFSMKICQNTFWCGEYQFPHHLH